MTKKNLIRPLELGLKEIFKQGVKYREPEKNEEGRGGEVIWAMPERNRFFLWEVFPYRHRL